MGRCSDGSDMQKTAISRPRSGVPRGGWVWYPGHENAPPWSRNAYITHHHRGNVDDVRDLVDERYPDLAAKAVRSRKAAIVAHCIECMGANRKDARECMSVRCRLWPHAFALYRQRAVGGAGDFR